MTKTKEWASNALRLADAGNGLVPMRNFPRECAGDTGIALEHRYFPGAGFDHELLSRWGLSR